MKKLTLVIVLAVAAAALFAQGAPGAAAKPALTSVSGTLAFVDERPAIKTDSGTVYLVMPDFYKYAYLDGIKAGAAIKATGMVISDESTMIAKEVSVGSKTYIIVGEGPRGERGGAAEPGQGREPGQGDQGRPMPPDLGRK